MATKIKSRISDKEFINICNNSESMAKACTKLGLHFNSFKKRAVELNCYLTNQSGKGSTKKGNGSKIPLNEILEGLHPYYQTNKLRKRLFVEDVKKYVCEVCNISEWNGYEITLELHHINGDRTDHKLSNLQIICPNCHSQTETYRSKVRIK